jgi:hypothetical protein
MGLNDKLQDEVNWTEDDWEQLIYDIEDKKCIPFIGPGASDEWIKFDEIVKEWVEKEWAPKVKYPYPLGDSSQLPRVSQFIAIIKKDETFPKKRLSRLLKNKTESLPFFSAPEYENTVYSVLADLNLPIYITTNYDRIMEKALIDKGKDPKSDYSRWKESKDKEFVQNNPNQERNTSYGYSNPDNSDNGHSGSSKPLVFHLLGDIDTPESMVLTEKDYIDFAIYISKVGDRYVFPYSIRQNIPKATLLFVGYRLEDITFIIVFEGFIKLMSLLQSRSIAVQVQMPPRIEIEDKENIQKYLNDFTENYFKINIYWGDPNTFLQQLRRRWFSTKK